MTTELADYEYEPVNEDAFEVRFLILLPGEREAPVQALLLSYPLMEKDYPPYEALSYAWGSPDDPMSVEIRTTDFREVESLFDNPSSHRRTFKYGQQDFGEILVTQNLGRALPYLRDRVRPRILWIDAICVNQKDLLERSNQVQRMADVYRLASRALVWLSEASDTSRVAFGFLEYLGSKVKCDFKTDQLSAASENLPESDAHVSVVFY